MSVQGESVAKTDLHNLCRLCAAKSDNCTPIFTAKGAELCLAEKISRCLPVRIVEEDALPQSICHECHQKLEYCREFFEQIYNATVKLLSLLRELESHNLDVSFDDELNQFIRNYAEPTADTQHNNDPLGAQNHHHRVVTKQEILDIDDNDDFNMDPSFQNGGPRRPSRRATRTTKCYKDSLSPDSILRESKSELIVGDERIVGIKQDFASYDEYNRGVVTKAEALDSIDDEEVKAEPAEEEEEEIEEEFDREEYHWEGAKNFLDRLLDEYENPIATSKKKTNRKGIKPRKRALSPDDEDDEYSPAKADGQPKPPKIKKKKVPGVKRIKGSKKNKQRFGRGMSCPPLKDCSICGHKSTSLTENINHWVKEHPSVEIVYKCDWAGCQLSTISVVEIKKHRRQHMIDDKQLEKCPDCDKYYPSKYLHNRHVLVHQENSSFDCAECDKKYKTQETLTNHMRSHHGPEDQKYTHICHLCGRKFTQKANLEAHMRVHSGVKPFSCDQCKKKFSQKGNLDEHRRVHTGEKPYVCDICGSRHTRKGELLLHIRCIHTRERPFQCSYCPKNFQRRDLLRKHERIHTDTRPYGCEFCGKTFTARDKMIVHRRLHTGERPYVCTFCGRGFCESGNLKKHLRVHGKDIPAVIKANNKGKGVERDGTAVNIDNITPSDDFTPLLGHVMDHMPVKQVRPRAKAVRKPVVQPIPTTADNEDELKEEEDRFEDEVKEEDPRGSVSSDFDTRDPGSRFPAQIEGGTTPDPQGTLPQGFSLTPGDSTAAAGDEPPSAGVSSHPLLHQIQSNWNVMYSQIQQPPSDPPPE